MKEDNASNTADSTKSEIKQGERIYPGSSLNWGGPQTTVKLIVELPFWVLTPDCKLSLVFEGCQIKCELINSGVEFQQGNRIERATTSTIYVGTAKANKTPIFPLSALGSGTAYRTTRTLVVFEASVLVDVLSALGEPAKRFNDALDYLRSLATGHIAVLNHLINSYRRISVDPYSSEVSEWDVPIWHLENDNRLAMIPIFPYQTWDVYPLQGLPIPCLLTIP